MFNIYGQYDNRTLYGVDWKPVRNRKRLNKQPHTEETSNKQSYNQQDDTDIWVTDGFYSIRCSSLNEVNHWLTQGFTVSNIK